MLINKKNNIENIREDLLETVKDTVSSAKNYQELLTDARQSVNETVKHTVSSAFKKYQELLTDARESVNEITKLKLVSNLCTRPEYVLHKLNYICYLIVSQFLE